MRISRGNPWIVWLGVPFALLVIAAAVVLGGGVQRSATASPASPCGDLDGSGQVNQVDVDIAETYLLKAIPAEAPAEVDLAAPKGGVVTFADVLVVHNQAAQNLITNCQTNPLGGHGTPSPTLPPTATPFASCVDLDGDTVIGVDDVNIALSWFNYQVPPAPAKVDVNGDTTVDLANDISLVVSQVDEPPVNCVYPKTPVPKPPTATPTATSSPTPTATPISACVDLNGDTKINVFDISIALSWFGYNVPPAPAKVDANGDTTVDLANDVALVISQVGLAPSNCDYPKTPVPYPPAATPTVTNTPTATYSPTPTPTPISVCVDLNGDTSVTVDDVNIALGWFGYSVPPAPTKVDVNGDTTIDLANDVSLVILQVGKAPVNCDYPKTPVPNAPTATPTITPTGTPTPVPSGCADMDGDDFWYDYFTAVGNPTLAANYGITGNDVSIVLSYVNTAGFPSVVDFNGDTVVDLANDVLGVSKLIGTAPYGCGSTEIVGHYQCPPTDVNKDGVVDEEDVRDVLEAMNYAPYIFDFPAPDVNVNGTVTQKDALLVLDDFGLVC